MPIRSDMDLSWLNSDPVFNAEITTKGWVTIHGHHVLLGASDGGSSGGGGGSGSGGVAAAATGPDAHSKEMFGTPPKVSYEAGTKPLLKKILGKAPEPEELAALAGGAGGTVRIEHNGEGRLLLRVKHKYLDPEHDDGESYRFLEKGPDGRPQLKNESLHVAESAPPGTGTRILATQARMAERLGIPRIITDAGGTASSGMNGYYTWPRLGYNAPLRASVQRDLPANLKGATTTHELFARPGGAEWWRENGSGMNGMVFETHKGSPSRQILDGYLEQKDIRLE